MSAGKCYASRGVVNLTSEPSKSRRTPIASGQY